MYVAASRHLRDAKRVVQKASNAACLLSPQLWSPLLRLCWWPLLAASTSLRIIKKEESEALQGNKVVGNGLPPKPEERWRYIKELESRQPGVRTPTEPSAGGEVKNADQLTDEQRQLLAQMQADMRQQPTQLNEVPWNEQTPAQRQQTLQRQRQAQQQTQQQQWTQTQPVQQPRTQPQQQTRTVQTQPVQQQPKAQPQKQTAQPYQDLLQTPAHTTAQQPKNAAGCAGHQRDRGTEADG